jgi:hypothetical protein
VYEVIGDGEAGSRCHAALPRRPDPAGAVPAQSLRTYFCVLFCLVPPIPR